MAGCTICKWCGLPRKEHLQEYAEDMCFADAKPRRVKTFLNCPEPGKDGYYHGYTE